MKEITQPFSLDGTATYWDTINPMDYFSHVSFADILWGLSLAVLLYLSILFLLAPKGFKYALRRMDLWKDFKQRMKDKEDYEAHITNEYAKDSPVNSFSWQLEEILYNYSRIQLSIWIFLTGASLWLFTLPVFIGPLDNNQTWGVVFIHSIRINGQYWTSYEIAFAILIYDLFMLAPSLRLAVKLKSSTKSHLMSLAESKGLEWNASIPKGTWGLILAKVLGMILLVLYTCWGFGAKTLFCSPIFWIYISSLVVDINLIYQKVKQENFVNRNYYEEHLELSDKPD